MNLKLLEPFREWVYKTRRRNGSQKPSGLFGLEDARKPQAGDNRPEAASDEIILRLEPANVEFMQKQRSSGASWLNLKQLIEPHAEHGELTYKTEISHDSKNYNLK